LKIAVAIIFFLAYAGFIFGFRWRVPIGVTACVALLFTGVFGLLGALASVNWAVMLIFSGTLVVAELFIQSRAPAALSEWLVGKTGRLNRAMLAICALAGLLSTVAENVATVLIVAPIVLEVARRAKVNPVPYVIGVSVSANLQGAATLIGDPPAMILASFMDLNFNDFFWYQGRPGMFFATQVGFAVSLLVLAWLYRKHREPIRMERRERINTWVPTSLLVLMTIGLALASALDLKLSPDGDSLMVGGLICAAAALIGVAWHVWRNGWAAGRKVASEYDWGTTSFLCTVFILVSSLTAVGMEKDLADVVGRIVGDQPFVAYNALVWVSVAVSAFLDNVPYTAAMLPAGALVADAIGADRSVYLFGIMLGASVGGNLSPVGAAANIVGMGVLARAGYKAGPKDFLKIGVPFTLISVLAASMFLWIAWEVLGS